VAYAPLLDDGTVAYETAALSLAAGPGLGARGGEGGGGAVIVAEGPPAAQAVVGWRGMDPARTKSRLIAKMRADLLAPAGAAPWVVVDVALRHNQLATLYPTRKGRGAGGAAARNEESFAVAEDLLRRLLTEEGPAVRGFGPPATGSGLVPGGAGLGAASPALQARLQQARRELGPQQSGVSLLERVAGGEG
jgi:hypothetical protein